MPKSANSGSSSSNNHNDTTNNSGKKRKRQVQVVVCPSAFPDFTTVGGSTSRRLQKERGIPPTGRDSTTTATSGVELDVQQTIREIHKFGATGFQGTQKKTHDKAEYEWLTGRTQKRQKIPTKILVGMRQKALKREERQKKELKESGVVSHHQTNTKSSSSSSSAKARSKKRRDDEPKAGPGVVQGVFGSNSRKNKKGNRRSMDAGSFGPAPDVGFMKKGVLRVKRR